MVFRLGDRGPTTRRRKVIGMSFMLNLCLERGISADVLE